MLGEARGRPRVRLRQDIDRPERAVVDILERHRHHARSSVDVDTTEELQAEAWREIFALLGAAALLEHGPRPKGVVEPARSPAACMQRAGHELPERLEILKDGPARIVVMRGR